VGHRRSPRQTANDAVDNVVDDVVDGVVDGVVEKVPGSVSFRRDARQNDPPDRIQGLPNRIAAKELN
jgi:hypothetical protein